MKKFSGLLLLEDGTAWDAIGFGYEGFGIGELCFNTSMTGYQEALTDPSYCEQILLMTTSHVGLSLIHISEPTRHHVIAYAVF